MARLRKAARLRQSPALADLAHRVMVGDGGAEFRVEPKTLFSSEGPLEIEIGAGLGDFIAAQARANPSRNFLAVELAGNAAFALTVRAARAGLSNLKVARMDARTLVNVLLPPQSVSVYHIYYPDPWPKRRHLKHRLFTPVFARGLGRTLVGNGRVCVATDVEWYASHIFSTLFAAGFVRRATGVSGAWGSRFGRRFIAAGKPVYSGVFEYPPVAAKNSNPYVLMMQSA